MKILAFAASLRAASWNKKLVERAAAHARDQGASVEVVDFRELLTPWYDGDLDASEGQPPGARELTRRLLEADAFLLAVPEYNYSIPGHLKNTIDWTSRVKPMPWKNKPGLLLSTSPGPIGGIRGLWQTRIPLEGCGAMLHPDMFALRDSPKMFDAEGNITDPALAARLEGLVGQFLDFAGRLTVARS